MSATPVTLPDGTMMLRGERRDVDGVEPSTVLEQPGDYCGPVFASEGPQWLYFLPPVPGMPVQMVTAPPYTFVEGADGSVEVEGELTAQGGATVWSGRLEVGHMWTWTDQ